MNTKLWGLEIDEEFKKYFANLNSFQGNLSKTGEKSSEQKKQQNTSNEFRGKK